jgi:Methyltransferase domain
MSIRRYIKSIGDKSKSDPSAMAKLMPLLVGYPFLPFSNSGLGAAELVILLNDIVMNRRRRVLEFGSGVSTILIARLASVNQLNNFQIISVDDNSQWLDVVRQLLAREGLEPYVRTTYAPLTDSPLGIHGLKWYDVGTLEQAVSDIQFDMVVVDGPAAYRQELRHARYPAAPFVVGRLAKGFSFYLDDTHRRGEREIMRLWRDRHGLQFTRVTEHLATFQKGEAFNVF